MQETISNSKQRELTTWLRSKSFKQPQKHLRKTLESTSTRPTPSISTGSRYTSSPMSRSAQRTFVRCFSVRLCLRPICLPSARARSIPAFVRLISRSRSNSATAFHTCRVILPTALVRSTPPNARQWTRHSTLAVQLSRVRAIALRPRRSSFVTTSTSPCSMRSRNFENPYR